jgi:hypothetical protein
MRRLIPSAPPISPEPCPSTGSVALDPVVGSRLSALRALATSLVSASSLAALELDDGLRPYSLVGSLT